MPKGYWIASLDVGDLKIYQAYVEMMVPIVWAYGGRFLVRAGEYQQVEGTGRTRQAVIEFESYEVAIACYRSPEYCAARAVRQQASSADFMLVRGVD